VASYRRTLRRIAGALEAPHAARVRVLEELAADLEALHAELVARGIPAREARRRAEALLGPSPEVLRQLGRAHRPLWTRLAARYGGGGAVLERFGLVVLAVAMVSGGVAGLQPTASLRDASPFLWPVLALLLGALGVAGLKALQLTRGTDVHPATLHRGLDLLLLLPVAALALAGLGILLEFWQTAELLSGTVVGQGWQVLVWARRSALLLAISLTGLLVLGLAWLLLATRTNVMYWRELALRAGRVPGDSPLDLEDLEDLEERRPA